MRFPAIITIIITLFTINLKGISQSVADAGDEFLNTQATSLKAGTDAKKHAPKKTKYLYIIKNNSQNTLKGNKCFEEVTKKFGFEYLIAPKNLPPKRTGFGRWMHNAGVKFILFFRNGPFWQLRLKKKYNQCKYQYGDFVG